MFKMIDLCILNDKPKNGYNVRSQVTSEKKRFA